MIVAGGALMATGLGGPIGVLLIGAASAALMSAGASAVNQKTTTGTVDWSQVGSQAIAGAGAGAIGAGVGVLGAHALAAVSARIASRSATAASGAGAETVVTGATQTATAEVTATSGRLLGDTAAQVAPKATVQTNKIAGDAFRDQVAARLESELGFDVIGTEVSVKTPLGRRAIDILAERNGGLVNFETKLGASRYRPSQRAKDWWISNIGVDIYGNGNQVTFPTMVIRGPLP
jgi:hypothetical protein